MSESTISLSKLIAWNGNVGRAGSSEGLSDLKASIASHGLLQSLVVRKANKGRFAVIAGERRRQALMQLAADGLIEPDHLVPCRVIAGGMDATEISLAENVMRMPMHPASLL